MTDLPSSKSSCLRLVGFGGLFAVCRLDYRKWYRVGIFRLWELRSLLVLVLIPGVGTRVLGAQRWIRLGAVQFSAGRARQVRRDFFRRKPAGAKKEIAFIPLRPE